jgi:enoyl-CoA hydratase/carnithine racemase
MEAEVLYDKHEGYAVFTLNRPQVLNAFNTTLREQFTDCMDDFESDPNMRVGIVTGAGRAFGTGADLKARSRGEDTIGGNSEKAARAHAGQFGRSKKLFIAAVNGPCIAGAFEWTLDMDIRICSPEAYFGLFEVKRGLLASFGLQRLPRMIPFGEAMYLVLTGDRMDAERALRCGLVHEVVPADALLPRAVEIAQMILGNHPLGVEGARALARHTVEGDAAGTRSLAEWVGRSVRNERDAAEGALAFAEKRDAVFEKA